MKIRKIRFSNIHNLKGEHEVDFEQAPLSTAGIFAITGPTGSGKSTILDVITLALFNRIPRFKASISKSKIQEFGSILTHHTNEAAASIEYEIKGQVFVSSWSVAKTRNNTLKDYEMSLMDSSGSYLDLKKSEVPDKNAEIIGLGYEQFVKSIILSQGQFSRFLKADKNERGQLLENLTGTSIYRNIGRQAYRKYTDFSNQAKLEKEKLDDIVLLSEEERESIQRDLDTAETEIASLNEQLKQQEALIAVKAALQDIAQGLKQNASEKENLDQRALEARAEEARLAKHEKLSGLKGDLSLFDKAKADITRLNAQLDSTRIQQESAKRKIETILSEVKAFTGSKVSQDGVNSRLNQFENEVLALDRQKAEKQQQGKEQRQIVNQRAGQYHLAIPERISPKEALALLENDRKVLTRWMEAAKLDQSTSISESKNRLRTQKESLELLKDLTHLLSESQKHAENISADQAQLSVQEKQLADVVPLIQKSEKLITQLKEKEQLLRKQKEDAIKIARLEALRPELEEGKPCPLCGSEHHPYTADAPDDARSELDEKIAATLEELHSENSSLEREKEKRTQLLTQVEHLKVSLEKQKTTLSELAEKEEALKTQYTGKEVLELSTLQSRIPQLTEQANSLEKAIEALEQFGTNDDLTRGFELFLEISKEYKEVDRKRSEKYAGHDVASHTERIRGELKTAQDSNLRLSTELGQLEQQLKQAQSDKTRLQTKLTPIAQAEGFTSIAELGSQLLPEEEVTRIRSDREKLQNAIAANTANRKNLEERKAKQDILDTAPESSLEVLQQDRMSTQQQQLSLVDKRGADRKTLEKDDADKERVANRAETLQKLEAEVQKWSLLNNMIGSATGDKFANFAQGITLQNLLVYANKRLQKLSDRYLLLKPEGEGSLKVLDQYQGNSERSVNTLSGGETFLLSLALALSLSDMASKNVSLDSLFIDEGFGTLDQETLDIAMNTLERLQTESQKTVGVISHVEALKERITVRVKLEKNSLGYSQIKVEG